MFYFIKIYGMNSIDDVETDFKNITFSNFKIQSTSRIN